MTPRERIERLAKDLGYTMDEIRGRSRLPDIVHARWAIMVDLHRVGFSSVNIGRMLNRDHSTVLHALTRCGVRRSPQAEWGRV